MSIEYSDLKLRRQLTKQNTHNHILKMSFPPLFKTERYQIRFLPDFRLRNKVSTMKRHAPANASLNSSRYIRRTSKAVAVQQYPALNDSWVRDNFKHDLGLVDYGGILKY